MWHECVAVKICGRKEDVESRKVRCTAIGSVGSRATAGHRRTAGMKVWYRASWYCWHAGECGTGHGATAGRKVQGMVLAGKCGMVQGMVVLGSIGTWQRYRRHLPLHTSYSPAQLRTGPEPGHIDLLRTAAAGRGQETRLWDLVIWGPSFLTPFDRAWDM